MPMRALLFVAAAMAASPGLSADPPKRNPDPSAASRSVATPAEVPAVSAEKERVAAPAKKRKRVRYTIPAPTRM